LTAAVEDAASMVAVLRAVDRASGYAVDAAVAGGREGNGSEAQGGDP